jgi:hypothetical protein
MRNVKATLTVASCCRCWLPVLLLLLLLQGTGEDCDRLQHQAISRLVI